MARKTTRRGTQNVLMDLGLPDAEELTAKAVLAKRINDILERRALTQSAAADLLGISRRTLSRKLKLYGVESARETYAS